MNIVDGIEVDEMTEKSVTDKEMAERYIVFTTNSSVDIDYIFYSFSSIV